MPRPCSRRYQPYLKVLKGIALDAEQPLPLRLRSIELSLAILSNVWEVASGKAAAKAVRSLVALDAIDKQLLELADAVKAIQQQQQPTKDAAPALETPEAAIDALIAQAEAERKEIDNAAKHN
jgi:hypothetical protein